MNPIQIHSHTQYNVIKFLSPINSIIMKGWGHLSPFSFYSQTPRKGKILSLDLLKNKTKKIKIGLLLFIYIFYILYIFS